MARIKSLKKFTFKHFGQFLGTTVPFVTAHLEIFHCTHHPVIPKSDLYFTFCSTLNVLSQTTSKYMLIDYSIALGNGMKPSTVRL